MVELMEIQPIPARLRRIRELLERATPNEMAQIKRKIAKSQADKRRYAEDIAYREAKKTRQATWRRENPEAVKAHNARAKEAK